MHDTSSLFMCYFVYWAFHQTILHPKTIVTVWQHLETVHCEIADYIKLIHSNTHWKHNRLQQLKLKMKVKGHLSRFSVVVELPDKEEQRVCVCVCRIFVHTGITTVTYCNTIIELNCFLA